MVGGTRCRFHGGALNRGKQRAALHDVENQIRRALPPEDQWVRRDPLEEMIRVRAEAGAWLDVCRAKVVELRDFEVTDLITLANSATVEKIGNSIRAIVTAYTQAMDRCFQMAAVAIKLNLDARYSDQLDRHAELFARVLSEGMRLLAIDVPPERYAAVIPAAIAAVQEEHGDMP